MPGAFLTWLGFTLPSAFQPPHSDFSAGTNSPSRSSDVIGPYLHLSSLGVSAGHGFEKSPLAQPGKAELKNSRPLSLSRQYCLACCIHNKSRLKGALQTPRPMGVLARYLYNYFT